jgi:hypothetical protein
VAVALRIKRGTAAQWAAVNPVLRVGEIGIEVPVTLGAPPRAKVGDGVTRWLALPYVTTTPIDGTVTAASIVAGGLPESSITNLTADLAAKETPAGAQAKATAAQAAAQAASQPLDSDLTAIAALSTTTFGRGLLALADGSALAATIPSGTYAQGLVATAVKTAPYTAAPKDYALIDATAGSVAVTLPTAPADGTRIGIKLVATAGTNVATFACGGSDHLNLTTGPTSGTITLLNQAVILQYASSTAVWTVQSSDLPLSQLDLRFLVNLTTPQTAALALVPSTASPMLSIKPVLPFTPTFTGPARAVEFLGGTGSNVMPYLLSAYFTPAGALYTGREIVVSNKRADIDGRILGVSPDGGTTTEPSMVVISPDVNGPSLAVESNSPVAVASKSLTANVVTLVCDRPFNSAVGRSVVVSGCGAPYDGTFVVTAIPVTVPANLQVQYAVTNANLASTAANGMMQDTGWTNQTVLSTFDISTPGGGAGPYNRDYGAKRGAVAGDLTLYYGASLLSAPFANATVKFGPGPTSTSLRASSIGTNDFSFLVNAGLGQTAYIKTQVAGVDALVFQTTGAGASAYVAVQGVGVMRLYNSSTIGKVAIGGGDDSGGTLTVLGNNSAVPVFRARRTSSSQSVDIVQVLSETPTVLSRFNKAGVFGTRVNAAPADADVATSEAMLWFDNTNGAGKLMVKAKTADGTVVTGSVVLA